MPKKASKNKAPAAAAGGAAKKAKTPAGSIVTMTKQQGTCAVDQVAAGMLGGASVIGENSCTLNQTNLVNANNNKFYICQALQAGGQYYEFSRWGRVGASGQTKLDPAGGSAGAVAAFEKKFKSKTANAWADRQNFVKKNGKYELIETEQDSMAAAAQTAGSAAAGADAAAKRAKASKVKSKLDKPTTDLVEWILDADMFKSAMAEFKVGPPIRSFCRPLDTSSSPRPVFPFKLPLCPPAPPSPP